LYNQWLKFLTEIGIYYQQSFVKALHHSARGENIYYG